MEENEYRERRYLIYRDFARAILEASNKRDLALSALNREFNETIDKKEG